MPPVLIEPLIERLRAGCVHILGKRPGCGFAVAAGWVITCAHVVGRQTALGSAVEVRPWQGPGREIRLHRLSAEVDLALLQDPAGSVPAVPFGRDLLLGDPLAGIGFPLFDGRAECDQFTAEYEGETHGRDPATGIERRLLKIKGGQIDRGFSGGPLLNLRTGQVVGVTRLSRDTGSDLGGWAVPADAVVELCRLAGIAAPPLETVDAPAHGEPTQETLRRIRDLLFGLPGWDSERRRYSFVAGALGKRHRVMGEVEWSGGARQLAWEVASACEDYPEPTASGLSPLCALLAAIPAELGPQPERDREIAALRALLRCPALGRHWGQDRC